MTSPIRRISALRLSVNGELRQDGNTQDMIFAVDHLVWYVSQFMVLRPGDVISTGTPARRRDGAAGQRRTCAPAMWWSSRSTASVVSVKCSGRPDVARFERIRALVTGGASGIGLATASRLAQEGARVAVLDLGATGPPPASTTCARI